MEPKVQAASSAALLALKCALPKADAVRECCEKLEGVEERLRAVQVAVNKTCDDPMVAEEEGSRFEADYVAEVNGSRDEAGELTK